MEKYLYEDLYTLEEKHWWHISKRRMVFEFISKYINGANCQILDIGCGTGKNLELLSQVGKTWGIDNSKKAIKFCENRGLRNLKIGLSYKTGFKDSNFDLVTLLDVLEHVDERKTLKEISRILKHGKLLIVTVPAYPWLWSKWDEVLHHKRRYTKLSLQLALEKNNFTVIKISYMFSFLILPALIIRMLKSRFLKNYYPSDFKLSLPIINKLLLKISRLEGIFIKNGYLPFGTSLICVAKND